MTLKSVLTTLCIILAFAFLPALLWAQGPGGGGPDPDPAVPIDGGVSLLVAAGVAYAVKKAHDKRKQGKTIVEREK